jgi:hypothetical protein
MIAESLSGGIGRDADACGEPAGLRRGLSGRRGHRPRPWCEAAAQLPERLLEGCGGQRLEREVEDVAVLAEHPTLADDFARARDDGPVLTLAHHICRRAAALEQALRRYRLAVRDAVAPSRSGDRDDDLPFCSSPDEAAGPSAGWWATIAPQPSR